jgi:hypothetical protein
MCATRALGRRPPLTLFPGRSRTAKRAVEAADSRPLLTVRRALSTGSTRVVVRISTLLSAGQAGPPGIRLEASARLPVRSQGFRNALGLATHSGGSSCRHPLGHRLDEANGKGLPAALQDRQSDDGRMRRARLRQSLTSAALGLAQTAPVGPRPDHGALAGSAWTPAVLTKLWTPCFAYGPGLVELFCDRPGP